MTPDDLREHERRAHAAGVAEGMRRAAWEAAELAAGYCIMASTVDGAAMAARLAANIADWARDMADALEAQQGERDGA